MPTPYLILIVIFGWGIGSFLLKLANDSLHPLMVTTVITAMYVVITPFIFLLFKFNTTTNFSGVMFAVAGGALMGLGSLGYYFALRNNQAGVITMLTSLAPVITLILSLLFLKEAISLKQGIGIVLALFSFILLGSK